MIFSIYLDVYIYRKEFGDKIGNGVPICQNGKMATTSSSSNYYYRKKIS